MPSHNPFLTDWIKNAYSMEMSLVTVLEQQTQEIGSGSQLRTGLDHHLQATRHHVDLLRDRLQEMGENVTAVRPANPISSMYGGANGGGPDASLRTGLIDFVTENFEIASYRALGALSSQLGDIDTARICEQILKDEMAMVRALDQLFPEVRRSDGQGPAVDNVRIAHENFGALNAHDLDRWAATIAEDGEAHAPATSGPMDKRQNRAYLENFLSAFPDLHFDLLRSIAQDNLVSVNWEAVGTHTGPLYTSDGTAIQPTHKVAKEFGDTTFEIIDGKIRRSWAYFDMSALLQQLGLMPKM